MSLDSFSNLVPLTFITLLKLKIEGCVNMRLPSDNYFCSAIKYILICRNVRKDVFRSSTHYICCHGDVIGFTEPKLDLLTLVADQLALFAVNRHPCQINHSYRTRNNVLVIWSQTQNGHLSLHLL